MNFDQGRVDQGKADMAKYLAIHINGQPTDAIVRTASAYLVNAITLLVWTGGRRETVKALERAIKRVRAGTFPEPSTHEPGNA